MTISIQPLDSAAAQARLDELAAVLVDAVANGASVNFLAGFAPEEARVFWQRQLPAIAAGETHLFVGEEAGRLVGTVLLMFAPQPNGSHRAEIGKMLVLSSAQRQGLGRRLLLTAEDAARAAGRTLLLLDTETGSAGDLLYRSCGWTELGTVPGHAFRPNGELAATTMFYKQLTPA